MKNYYNQSSFLIVISLVILSVFSSCKNGNEKKSNNLFFINAGNGNSFAGQGNNSSSTDNLYANNLSNYKSRANVSMANASSGLDLPTMTTPSPIDVSVDVQNTTQHSGSLSSNNKYSQLSQSNSFKSTSANNLNQESELVADINSTIKERTVSIGSEKANTKLNSKSTAASSKVSPQKADEKPGEPGYTGNLPVGDGIWILLSFVCAYAGKKFLLTF
jgi:hypothetical protein